MLDVQKSDGGGGSRTRTSLRLDFPAMQGIYRELCEFEEVLLHFKTVKPSFSEDYSTKFPINRNRELF